MDDGIQLFATDIGAYHDASFTTLDTGQEIEQLAQLLAGFGARLVRWPVPMPERDRDAVASRLQAWAAATPARHTLLYWAGHGMSDGQDASLAYANSPSGDVSEGLAPAYLAAKIRAREANPSNAGTSAIVVIEACRSRRFVELVSASLDSQPHGPRRVMLVGVSGDGPTRLGTFRVALERILRVSFRNQERVSLWQLATELARDLPGSKIIAPGEDEALVRSVPAVPGAVALDALRDLERLISNLSEDERRHFIPKAQGGDNGETTWYFQGRRRERAQISEWLRSRDGGMLVVTGPAGSGKSALLGDLVVRSQSTLRQLLTQHRLIDDVPAAQNPPDDSIDMSIVLTGATFGEVVKRLGAVASLSAPAPDEPPTTQADRLREALQDQGGRFTFVLDAVDEAEEPLRLADQLLRPLAATPGVRLVVGTRGSTSEDPDCAGPPDTRLLRALTRKPASGPRTARGRSRQRRAQALGPVVITLPRDGEAIAGYVKHRLRAAAERDALAASDDAITSAAWMISGKAQHFLFARLAVHEILSRPALLEPAHVTELVQLATATHSGLFETVVGRLASSSPASVFLLEALALGKGRGLPALDGVWSSIASAIAGSEVTSEDVDDLLCRAEPYLVLAAERGQAVYRLAHHTFKEQLAARSREPQRRNLQITERLLAAASSPAGRINPYLTYHLSQHAADAGLAGWQRLAECPDILDRLDPRVVAADAEPRGADLPPQIRGIAAAYEQLAGLPPAARRTTREVAAFLHTSVRMDPPTSSWALGWAAIRRGLASNATARYPGSVLALATGATQDLGDLVASGEDDGILRLWDARTGRAHRKPIAAHPGWVRAVVVIGLPSGGVIVATGGGDGSVLFWDAATGEAVSSRQAGHTGGVWAAAAVPLPGGGALVATGGADGTVRLWDPATGEAACGALTGHTGAVLAIAAVPMRGSAALVASTGMDGTVRLWEPATGKALGTPLAGRNGPSRAIAAVPRPSGSPLVACGGADGSLRLWNPSTGQPDGRLLATHQGAVHAVTTLPSPGSNALIVSGGADGIVRLHDLDAGAERGRSAEFGISLPVRAIAAVPDGIAIGTPDGLLCLLRRDSAQGG